MEISKKKPFFAIREPLTSYLDQYSRHLELPVKYDELAQYRESFPLFDKHDNNTLWDCLIYDESFYEELHENLLMTYSLLKTDGDKEITNHLRVERIDFCHFGNSKPFRVKIVNLLNDNYDYMYVKKADSSRVYGLELEHLLSPNFISYLVHNDTLVEEHIAGIPGDEFLKTELERPNFNRVRFVKEFIKFNERCFIRLLGEMRSYNYVIDITPDFEDEQYRIRAIDFDQQSYEGNKSVYLPQYFKENNPIIEMGMDFVSVATTRQYQFEERTLIARRLKLEYDRVDELIECMREDTISVPEKVEQLKQDLNQMSDTTVFNECTNMGDILKVQLRFMLSGHVAKLNF
jgi:hypothetical protein